VDPLRTRADVQEGEGLEEEAEAEAEAAEGEDERKWTDRSEAEAPRKYQVIGTVLDCEVMYPEVPFFTLINGTFSARRSTTRSSLALSLSRSCFPPSLSLSFFLSISLSRRMAISGNVGGCPVNSADVSICSCRVFASSSLVYLPRLMHRIIHLLVPRYRHQQQNETRMQETRGRDLARGMSASLARNAI